MDGLIRDRVARAVRVKRAGFLLQQRGLKVTRQLYHLPNIRDLLLRGFNNSDLRILCYDVPDFRPVFDELGEGTGKAEIVDKLIQHAEKTLQIDTLLALAKERNPARYEEHGPYYADDPTAALQKQVSDLAQRLSAITSATSLTREQQYQVALHWAELGRKDSLRGFDLREADLRAVDLAQATLCVADLWRAKLILANLAKADLRLGNLGEADLRGANLSEANLRGADLREAKLGGADLRKADLNGADLRKADLSGASLRGADLRGASLIEADLTGADLREANLFQAKVPSGLLVQAGTIQGATMPGGTVYDFPD